MAPTRKRRGSHCTDGRSEDDFKRSKRSNPVAYNPQIICQELYDVMRNQKMEDGQLLCEPFIRVPKRRTEPEYYATVSTPMDLLKIQHKLKSEDYDDVGEMTADVELMVNNAKSFYQKQSSEYKQAQILWELFCQTKSRLFSQAFGDSFPEEIDDGEREEELYDEDASRLSSEEVMDVSLQSSVKDDAVTLKVPVLKLKVAGNYVETTSCLEKIETSLDTDTVSENQSCFSARLSSGSEQEDLNSEIKINLHTSYSEGGQKRKSRKKHTESDIRNIHLKLESAEEDENIYEQMFTAVVMASDETHLLSEMFKILPSRSKLPDYYQIIKEPIDLRKIALKIQSSSYNSLDEMVKDLLLMVQNAKTFNEPGSQIYKDATALRKIIMSKKHECEQHKTIPHSVRSQRIRSRSVASSQNISTVIAAMKTESDEEDVKPDVSSAAKSTIATAECLDRSSEAECSGNEDENDELWNLYNTVKNFKTTLGQLMCDPFLRLPSKRIYPDYYEEIKHPMSMMKIQKKLKNGRYEDLDSLASDFNLLFENAKQYNMEDSKIYKDAAKLQMIMRNKKLELARSKDSTLTPCLEIKSPKSQTEIASIGSDDSIRDSKKKRARVSEEPLKKRLWLLHKVIMDYQVDGRHLVDMFVTLPLKKDYPDYYKVISEPIDMMIIENKIKSDKYSSLQSLVSDLELMFKNARHYNEEDSQIYKDAETLEQILFNRARLLPQTESCNIPTVGKTPVRSNRPKTKFATSLTAKLQDLYNAIRDFADVRGRTLSTPFMKLPLKADYPDYYEIIKRPIDMQRIFQRMMSNQYHAVEDMVSDLVLMFDNACKYNEPESLIYKDALTLQRICLEKKSELCADDDSNEAPDVQALVQELMMNLFISTFSHTDEEGRCYSDSFLELPSRLPSEDDTEDSKQTLKLAPSFELIKRNLDKGYYRRMDHFQDDLFEVFEYARRASSIDSQVYEDSVDLQHYYIVQRDELCKKGEILLTPALNYTELHLNHLIECERKERMTKEQRDDEERKKETIDSNSGEKVDEDVIESHDQNKEKYPGCADFFESNGEVYHIGDFVYIEPRDREKGLAPHVVCIERLHKGDDGEQWLHGCWFLRPNETYHLATRKFLQKEVFKSDFYDSVPFGKVLGKCFVMCVKEYFKMRPEGIPADHVYVCESRYSGRSKMFKKIKIWQVPKNDHVKIVLRDHLLTPVRVTSVFADKSSHEIDRVVEDCQFEALDKNREVIIIDNYPNAEEGCTYYEQFQAPTCWVKLGDCVYMRSSIDEKPLIARIDKLWTSSSGDAFFHGPYFILPCDVEHPPTRLFYKKEVFRSSREDTNPVLSITGRCSILSFKEYCSCRVTEIHEANVYLCESKYLDTEKIIKKFSKPFKRISLTVNVCDDEIYFFKKPLIPHKEPSPLLLKSSEVKNIEEESMDYCSSSVDQSFNETSSYQGELTFEQTPTTGKKKKRINKVRTISGYIVYAGECRRDIQAEFPDFNFGEISRAVGNRWKALPKEMKEKYEERAKIIAADASARNADSICLSQYPSFPSPSADSRSMSPHPSGHPGSPFCSSSGHAILPSQSQSRTSVSQPNTMANTYQLPVGIAPNQAFPSGYGPPCHPATNLQVHSGGVQSLAFSKPPAPIFVSVPPKTQRLVHSDAYLRYIEGMSSGNRNIGDFEKTLNAAPPSCFQPSSNLKLPVHWLANGPGHHDNVSNALWALRDLMLKDALNISYIPAITN